MLYDKIADLKKTGARAFEKDSHEINYLPTSFEEIRKSESKKHHRSFDVLRIEVRFMNVTKRKSVFKTLNMPDSQPFTFQDAFSVDHS